MKSFILLALSLLISSQAIADDSGRPFAPSQAQWLAQVSEANCRLYAQASGLPVYVTVFAAPVKGEPGNELLVTHLEITSSAKAGLVTPALLERFCANTITINAERFGFKWFTKGHVIHQRSGNGAASWGGK